MEAEVPGFTKDQISITAEGNTLHIRGTAESKKDDKATDGHTLMHSERTKSTFDRYVRLPAAISPSKVTAALNHGVLEITLPKEKPATIAIAIQ